MAALPVVLAAALAAGSALAGCGGANAPAALSRPRGSAAPGATGPAGASPAAVPTPRSVTQLGALVVDAVPSGLPRMPDAELRPPAGPKDAAEVADYSDDPEHEREVLERYGFRFGWERFWGTGSGPVTSVFVDQFDDAAGAGEFTGDVARNDAEHYDATLHERPPELPAGCFLLTVDRADPRVGLDGPAAFAWCASGPFGVAVTSVRRSVDDAVDEVSAVVRAQLARLPRS